MKIRVKIILIVLPIIIVSLSLAQTASYFNAVNGITRIAQQFLNFKILQLQNYCDSQWELLTENSYESRPDMILAAQEAAASYAQSILASDTELILALNDSGKVVMSTRPVEISEDEALAILPLLQEESGSLGSAILGGSNRVFRHFYFIPFQWHILITEEYPVFYADAEKATIQTLIILAIALSGSALLLMVFAGNITKPLGRVISAMSNIIGGGNLSARVPIEYRDETGLLALTFNTMLGELEKAYERIKAQAFEAVLAQKKEERIRTIFQKYVPNDLIEKFFASPESMLVGDNRELAILFSDIRSFTTISENLSPDELVKSLNRYFSGQVDIIMNRNGIVDKYIGDAIMAFWGAPLKHSDDPLQAVLSGLDMLDAVKDFNKKQKELGNNEFNIGIGINYGTVTVGNIGSERKMDYTVIGDAVNLASRMEGLTKPYHAEILISEFIYTELLKNDTQDLAFRLLDTVAVKGKTKGVKIYTVQRKVTGDLAKAWVMHNEAMELYYRRSFDAAAQLFARVLTLLPDDYNALALMERCRAYAQNAPPENWDGVEVMHSK